MSEEIPHANELNLGTQPLDGLMTELVLANHDIVAACEEHLTHKAVQRARKGRRITPHMKRRITAAFNKALIMHGKELEHEKKVVELFTY